MLKGKRIRSLRVRRLSKSRSVSLAHHHKITSILLLENIDDADLEESESESRDKICRIKVETFVNNSTSGKAIEVLIALLSLLSSLAFIVLTYLDLRYLNPCCNAALNDYTTYVETS